MGTISTDVPHVEHVLWALALGTNWGTG